VLGDNLVLGVDVFFDDGVVVVGVQDNQNLGQFTGDVHDVFVFIVAVIGPDAFFIHPSAAGGVLGDHFIIGAAGPTFAQAALIIVFQLIIRRRITQLAGLPPVIIPGQLKIITGIADHLISRKIIKRGAQCVVNLTFLIPLVILLF